MFDITMNGKNIGKASVEQQGLYYRFSCQCSFDDNKIHAVWVCWEGGSRKLGVCVPHGLQYGLETKVPVKYIPSGDLSFVVDHKDKQQDDFYPVDAEKPFAQIDQLASARFDIRDGKPGLVIPK